MKFPARFAIRFSGKDVSVPPDYLVIGGLRTLWQLSISSTSSALSQHRWDARSVIRSVAPCDTRSVVVSHLVNTFSLVHSWEFVRNPSTVANYLPLEARLLCFFEANPETCWERGRSVITLVFLHSTRTRSLLSRRLSLPRFPVPWHTCRCRCRTPW